MAQNFDHIFNWRLLRGSHDFPGPDGGTCINEAAVIAAGFPYRAVKTVADCPPCFSRPIAAYALLLNDLLSDDRRHLLLPFVTRLAGTADTAEVEAQRFEFLIVGLFRRCISLALWAKFPKLARRAAAVETVRDCRILCRALALDFELDLDLALALAPDLGPARARARALAHALDLALDPDHDPDLQRKVEIAAVALLQDVLEIGKKAELLPEAEAKSRLEAAKLPA